ncbi:MAG TPA: NUDIX domain-containing protein [Trueperaceae bacterium]
MSPRDELLDVLDESGEKTGVTKPRSEVHSDGDWHRVFHLWIVREDGYLVLQRRSGQKDLEPNKVDVTVGGHLAAGESAFDATREAEEELGLEVTPERLAFLGTWRSQRSYEHAVDREFQEVFALVNDWPLEQYSLSCAEVYLLYELPLSRAIELYRDGTPVPVAGFDCQLRKNDALLVTSDLIEQARGTVTEQLLALSHWLAGVTAP